MSTHLILYINWYFIDIEILRFNLETRWKSWRGILCTQWISHKISAVCTTHS